MTDQEKILQMQTNERIESRRFIVGYPYFILNNEKILGMADYRKELSEIAGYYVAYKKGTIFYPEGTSGDYVPSMIRFKKVKMLIDKEARFMFSQTPDINITAQGTDETEQEKIDIYKKVIAEVAKRSNLSKMLLQAAKDCFVGKRVACLIDISEDKGVLIHFYTSLEFYYETEYGSSRLTKFISFENVQRSKSSDDRRFLVNRYEIRNNTVYMKSDLYDGGGRVIEQLIQEQPLSITEIPAVVITNDGTLTDAGGVSEVESLMDLESGYSRLANSDVDSERKGMNPVNYVVDMNSKTTKDLPTGPGSFWEFKSEQNQNEVHPMVGKLSPDMNHTEAVKTTLERMENAMYAELDVPNISADTMAGTITSGKTLEALYYPLSVRCDEKLKTWKPALEQVVRYVFDLALLNIDVVKSVYGISDFTEVPYNVEVVENYALLKDEESEKTLDMQEIAADTRSRLSYLEKWRPDLKTKEKREAELMQIAIEKNMFDTMSMNTQVQNKINRNNTEQQVEENIEQVESES